MRAILFDQPGEPEQVLRMADVPAPVLHAQEQRVRVTARPIQPADRFFIRGQYRIRPILPQVAGLEGVGVVLDGPTGPFAKGTRVAFRSPGSWAELVAVPAERLIPVPQGIPDAAACQISLNPLTAWALVDEAEATSGDWMLLTAGASTVSSLIAAIARARGIRTIGIIRGDAAAAAARSAADHVFSVQDAQLLAKVSEVSGGKVAALLDSVGGPIVPTLIPALAAGAKIVAYGVQDREPAAVTNAMLIYANLVWKGFGIDWWLSRRTPEALNRILSSLWDLIRRDALPLPVGATFPLADFREALAADAEPGRRGKILLT
jgi:NADPH:quinone reductase-like Zn-dependent oxidoreductase